MMQSGKQALNERVQFLSKVNILKELDHYEKFKIAEAMQMRKVEDDEVIVKEGEPGSEFFIIQSGECHVYKQVLVDVTQCLLK
mmetsp:Transcript_37755/g.119285  ORF Transcript_37755/g.119285 Transcript_37755/m.119285 type:complete len:83 (+) Transcript_37755:1137-1385(+)